MKARVFYHEFRREVRPQNIDYRNPFMEGIKTGLLISGVLWLVVVLVWLLVRYLTFVS